MPARSEHQLLILCEGLFGGRSALKTGCRMASRTHVFVHCFGQCDPHCGQEEVSAFPRCSLRSVFGAAVNSHPHLCAWRKRFLKTWSSLDVVTQTDRNASTLTQQVTQACLRCQKYSDCKHMPAEHVLLFVSKDMGTKHSALLHSKYMAAQHGVFFDCQNIWQQNIVCYYWTEKIWKHFSNTSKL